MGGGGGGQGASEGGLGSGGVGGSDRLAWCCAAGSGPDCEHECVAGLPMRVGGGLGGRVD